MFAETDSPETSWEAWWHKENALLGDAPLSTKVWLVAVPQSRFIFLTWGVTSLLKNDLKKHGGAVTNREATTADVFMAAIIVTAALVLLTWWSGYSTRWGATTP